MKARSHGFYFTVVDAIVILTVGGIIFALSANIPFTLLVTAVFAGMVGFKGWFLIEE